jgi:hypothetical protein
MTEEKKHYTESEVAMARLSSLSNTPTGREIIAYILFHSNIFSFGGGKDRDMGLMILQHCGALSYDNEGKPLIKDLYYLVDKMLKE